MTAIVKQAIYRTDVWYTEKVTRSGYRATQNRRLTFMCGHFREEKGSVAHRTVKIVHCKDCMAGKPPIKLPKEGGYHRHISQPLLMEYLGVSAAAAKRKHTAKSG